MRTRFVQAFLAGLLGCAGAVPAAADLLGSAFGWQYYAYGGPYTYGPSTGGTFVDNGGVGGTSQDALNTYFRILAGDGSITFSYAAGTFGGPQTWGGSRLSLAPVIYNGIAIDLLSGPAFSGITIDPATNMAGFNVSDFSFTDSQLEVNWANLPFDRRTIVKFDITTAPEPPSLLLLALGLALAAHMMWKRWPCLDTVTGLD